MRKNQTKVIVQNLLRAASWNTIAGISSRALLFFVTIVVARTLPQDVYGAYAFILSSAYTIANIAGFGLNVYAAKLIAEDRQNNNNQRNLVKIIEIIAAVFSVLAILAVFILSETIFNRTPDPILTRKLMLQSTVFAFLLTVGGVQNSIAIGLGLYKSMAIANIFTSAISASIQLALIKSYGATGIIIGITLSQFISVAIFRAMIKNILRNEKNERENYQHALKSIYKVLLRSAPVFVSGLTVTAALWWINYLLVTQENGFREMATLSLASQWRIVILFVPEIIVSMMLPQLTTLFLQKRIETFTSYMFWGAGVVFIISTFLAVIAIILSQYLTSIYGAAYVGGKFIFIEMALACILIAVNSVIGQVIVSTKYVWYGLFFNIFWAVIVTTSSYVFIVKFGLGALGITHALLFSYFIHSTLQLIFIKLFLGRVRLTLN